MVKKSKSAINKGLEYMLNNPQTSPLNNPAVYNQLMSATAQPLSESLKYIGKKGAKQPDKSAERLKKLEEATENK
jgi:hypothetical protein